MAKVRQEKRSGKSFFGYYQHPAARRMRDALAGAAKAMLAAAGEATGRQFP